MLSQYHFEKPALIGMKEFCLKFVKLFILIFSWCSLFSKEILSSLLLSEQTPECLSGLDA